MLGEYIYLPYTFDSAELKLLAATQVDTEKTESWYSSGFLIMGGLLFDFMIGKGTYIKI